MRKGILICLIAALLILSACQAVPASPAATPVTAPTPAPTNASPTPEPTPIVSLDGSYSLETRTVYFPDGSTDADAEFVLTYEFPYFLADSLAANAMNSNIELYVEELFERVNEEYLLTAMEGDDVARLDVKTRITYVGDYTNVIFDERLTFGNKSLDMPFTLPMDKNGSEIGLAEVSGGGDVEALVAQLVYNHIDKERDTYFAFGSPDAVRRYIDLYNGYYITETGYALCFAPGTLAAEVEGPITIEIKTEELYPDFVGDLISAKSYVAIKPKLDMLASCCITADFESFDGAPSRRVATQFMADYINGLPYPPQPPISQDGDALIISKAEFDKLYSQMFSSAFPGVDEMLGSVALDGDSFKIALTDPGEDYRVALESAQATDDGVTLSGSVVYCPQNGVTPETVTGVMIELTGSDSDGYKVLSFVITR